MAVANRQDGAAERRKSGRVRARPELFAEDPALSQSNAQAKRKRKNDAASSGPEDSEMEDSDDEEEVISDEGVAATTAKNSKKKANGAGLAIRGAKPAPKKRKSGASAARTRVSTSGGNHDNVLFGDVFSKGRDIQETITEWLSNWDKHNSQAMTNLINFVITSTGCTTMLQVHDIEDPDNAVQILTDVQDVFAAQEPGDYPLISRAKTSVPFRSTFVQFFETLIRSCHKSGQLYSDLAIIENIDVWVSTMSSSGMRPMRHTATTASLAIATELCAVAAELADSEAKTARQKQNEQKKKTVNKARVKDLEQSITELQRKRQSVDDLIKSVFDAVFVHRYRDVDSRIRVDCVAALGKWIGILPDVFFEGMYLRYLGWLMSDTNAPTRLEVIKQLTKLFNNKDNVARLRTFVERFRSRMVEIAMRDAEVNVRIAAIELLDRVRDTGLLEPDDIDNIGRLIFDSEARVRKTVAGFFAENVNDVYENSVEELGGDENLTELLGDEADEISKSPNRTWLKLKAGVEIVQSYDAEQMGNGINQDNAQLISTTDAAQAPGQAAAQTICLGCEEARNWESIANYLLYDFSAGNSPIEKRCNLSDQEETFLLVMLQESVKIKLLESAEVEHEKRGKKSKVRKSETRESLEIVNMSMAKVVPNLMKKFGTSAPKLISILHLEHLLDLSVLHEMQQDSTTYDSLLDDVIKHLKSHENATVLTEACKVLLHARGHDELQPLVESKVQDLWQSLSTDLGHKLARPDWTEDVSDMVVIVRRMASLAGVIDCIDALEQKTRATKSTKKSAAQPLSILDLLMTLLRNLSIEKINDEATETLLSSCMNALLLYHMWHVRRLSQAKPGTMTASNLPDWVNLASLLTTLFINQDRPAPIRLTIFAHLMDLHTLYSTLRHKDSPLPSLVHPVNEEVAAQILPIFTSLEKSFATATKRKLELTKKSKKSRENEDIDADDEEEQINKLPEDDEDSEDADDDDDESDEDIAVGSFGADSQAKKSKAAKQQHMLTLERRLCEFTSKVVLGIIARVVDVEEQIGPIRTRISRNRTRLGPNYRHIIAFLDESTSSKTMTQSKSDSGRLKRPSLISGAKKGRPEDGPKTKSHAIVSEEDEDSDEDGNENEDDEEAAHAVEVGDEDVENEVVQGDGDDDEDEVMGD